ncbi:hypothetical protein FQN57_006603 [Myotisia sp. PD_48]|nr:hypothetical protein FQN57_006603 [Myotisia sp. PD_48]
MAGRLTPDPKDATVAVPNTPSPEPSQYSQASASGASIASSDLKKPSLASPLPRTTSSEMTPPPSVQAPINLSSTTPARSRAMSNPLFASPPATVDQTLCVAYGASEHLPSLHDIDSADEDALRKISHELLVVAQEYRMSAAHYKLQNSLMSLTSNEAVKRAEVEQQLARREVEILQSDEYKNRRGLTQSFSQLSQNDELIAARERIHALEQRNTLFERRIHRAKQIIEEKSDQYELLLEENSRLKKRIRDNREHFTLMMDRGGPLPSSPHIEYLTPQRKTTQRDPDSARPNAATRLGSQDLLATLLAADQVLHGDAASVQSSPAKHRNVRNPRGHTRGAHSMSSLAPPPSRSTGPTLSSQSHLFTPVNNNGNIRRSALRDFDSPSPAVKYIGGHDDDLDRHDRDSTISASDVEEAVTDEELPASQASSLATSMLRRYPGPPSQEEPSIPPNISKSSAILQSKLFGHVKKAGLDHPTTDKMKRKISLDGKAFSPKKHRAAASVDFDARF